ncbi:MAG: energy transducer TonB [Gammaproteobacteria bacterium]|nr:MAG: energy transducer TonB [Gammaproteobacteria bacterium]
MSSSINTWNEPFLPWVESENDRRFKRILLVCLVISTVLGAIVPFLPTPTPEQKDLKTVSPRLAKLITEVKKQPPPPPPPPKPVEKRETIKKPEPKKELTKKQTEAKVKASNTGLVALSNELSSLHDSFDMADFNDKPLKKSSEIAKESFDRNVIAANASKDSGGINTSKLSQNTGGSGKLESRSTSNVSSTLASNTPSTAVKRTTSGKLVRPDNEIEKVFQENKGAIFSLYNRALRKDPGLQGKVILELTIAPNGTVTACKILSSDLKNDDFERKLIARVKLFKFKPSSADVMTVKYPIDFLPS